MFFSPHTRPRICRHSLAIAAGIALASFASHATDAEQKPAPDELTTAATPWSMVLGGAIISSPVYSGSNEREIKLRPLWALQYGRFRFAPSRAGAMLGASGGDNSAQSLGASIDLFSAARITGGVAMRVDPKRKSSDNERLTGLPDIQATLRARAYAGYKITERWSLSAGVSQDILGRDGGGLANIDLSYGGRITPNVGWSVGTGMTYGDATYMKTHYGISQETSARTERAAYAPGAGVRDISIGGSLNVRFAPRWFGFVSAGVSQLQGGAADSPLTASKQSVGASIGVGYRFGPMTDAKR